MSRITPVNFTVMVTKSPFDSRNSQNAINFCHAAIAQGHKIRQVFFYQSGVHNASSLLMPNSDEINIYKLWCELNLLHNIELNVCVTAASRRGVVDDVVALRPEKANLKLPFKQVGLSAYFEALSNSVNIQL